MSRIGARPIKIEDGVNVGVAAKVFTANFGDNEQKVSIPDSLAVIVEENQIKITRKSDTKTARSQHGLISRLIQNAILGVKEGFRKELTFSGTGYRVSVDNNEFVLNMGYSHEIRLNIPDSITIEVKKNQINIIGRDKFIVGQFAAIVRDVRKPEVYKGKGLKYKDETIKRKAGKKASSS